MPLIGPEKMASVGFKPVTLDSNILSDTLQTTVLKTFDGNFFSCASVPFCNWFYVNFAIFPSVGNNPVANYLFKNAHKGVTLA